ncbi:MAG: DUF1926 domain-containing protein [Candidatus Melainabacteria bacterium]|nr:DUF1926 domain-containing protein [Candidatus Melainabacteria bacterium]
MSKLFCMTRSSQKLNLLLGFHSHLPHAHSNNNENESIKSQVNFQIGLIDLLNDFQTIRTSFHISGNLISYLDRNHTNFSSSIRNLLDRNQLELFSGGIYEPIFSFTPKDDRQTQLLLMNRLLNHIYGYTPFGAWITELSWEPSLALDLAKSRIQYTCLPKEYFTHSGLQENEISGYYLTEEEGRKIAVFPISHDLDSLMEQYSAEETINNLLKNNEKTTTENSSIVLFHKNEGSDINKLTWLRDFFEILYKKNDLVETRLFNDYFLSNKPKGRIYLPAIQDLQSQSNSRHWKHLLLKYHEVNLLHKKMLRVSKKINSAKEGKSRFKVIKEMISQAQDLLLKGQTNNAYWDNVSGGIYTPQERHNTYANLIKAENLIDAASRHGTKWIQVYEIDYDCDGHDEIIVETETQNVYISPGLGGTILEHDFRPKNINLTNTISRKKELYHNSENQKSELLQNGNLIYDNYSKLNSIDHFLEKGFDLKRCKSNQLHHLTKEIIHPYQVEKIKAKEETCKITLTSNIDLKLEANPQIELKKQISLRSGDSSLTFDYTLINKSANKIDFIFAVEFNINITPLDIHDCYFYLEGNKNHKTQSPALTSDEEIKGINEISIYNRTQGMDLTFLWSKQCDLFRYPIQTISYNHKNLKNIYQGTTLFPSWHIVLEPNVPYELSIKEEINTAQEEL